jgi:hypothetical protein
MRSSRQTATPPGASLCAPPRSPRTAGALLAAVAVAAAATAASSCSPRTVYVRPDPINPPTRTAIQDTALRTLVLELVASQLCLRMEGSLVGLSDTNTVDPFPARGRASAVGRLAIDQCQAVRQGDGIAIRMVGRGWKWVTQTDSGPVGTSYTVRGYVRFATTIDMRVQADVGYDVEHRRAAIWLTPTAPVTAAVAPIGELPVESNGIGSAILGGVGSVFGSSPAAVARQRFPEVGARLVVEEMQPGISLTYDFCRRQLDFMMAPLRLGEIPLRPFENTTRPWLANQRVVLHPGGLDAAGPFRRSQGTLELNVEVENGGPVVVRQVCRDAGMAAVNQWFTSSTVPSVPTETLVTTTAQLRFAPQNCDSVILFTPRSGSTQFRYALYDLADTDEPLLHCPAPPQ